ncbi:lipopolysaccharide biosynthesis protein [Pseudorhodobacter sp. W20_MBD10_FR17]|uniref:lipopolysaccharide biosynthesis protein n=1 Tax=Pseudorhodobacter sp. W20_MBD10_FR17 TaxID=3240266 RepID=UPI003F97CE21
MKKATTANPYMRTVILAFGARGFAVGSQFLITIVLAKILGAGPFGDMIVVFAAFRLISLSIGTGLSTLIIYHVSRSGGEVELNERIHRSSLAVGIIISALIGSILLLSADTIAGIFDKQGMAYWITGLTPYLIFLTVLTISSGSFDGRSKVDFSIFIADFVPNFIQIAGLALVFVAGLGKLSICVVFGASVVLPALLAAGPIIATKVHKWYVFTFWDIRYAGTYAMTMLASQQIHGIDLMIVGALFSSETSGAYAVCARISLLIPFVQLILLRKYTPIAGLYLSNGNISAFNNGLHNLKVWIMASVFLLSGLIVLVFPFLQHFLGKDLSVIAFLIVLLPVFFARACFSGIDVALKMSGRAEIALMLSLLGAALFCLLTLAFQTLLGSLATGFALTLSALITSIGGSLFLLRHGIKVTDISSITVCLAASAITSTALYLITANSTPFILSAALLLLSAIVLAPTVWRRART